MSEPTKEQIERLGRLCGLKTRLSVLESVALEDVLAAYEERGRELTHIDDVLARRPALDLPTRAENIEKAINTAKLADERGREVERLRAELDNEHEAACFWQTKGERADRLLDELEHAETRLREVVRAASDVAEGACSFEDSRLRYEEWQINVGSMERLRAALAAAQPEKESR